MQINNINLPKRSRAVKYYTFIINIIFAYHLIIKFMAKNLFNRYIWLLDTIDSRKSLSFENINSLWRESPLNDDGKDLPIMTFHNHIAIIQEDIKLETLLIKVCKEQVNHIRSLQMHHSQKEIETKDDYSIFQFKIKPTYDFKQAVFLTLTLIFLLTYNSL
ncbi:MAG: hypothetical protein PHD45_04575 [Bacteroidales bacterium]|nr:hypothetical protein [Bacteroidales bacterium]